MQAKLRQTGKLDAVEQISKLAMPRRGKLTGNAERNSKNKSGNSLVSIVIEGEILVPYVRILD